MGYKRVKWKIMEMNVNQSINDMKSILPRRVDFVKLIEFTVVNVFYDFRRKALLFISFS